MKVWFTLLCCWAWLCGCCDAQAPSPVKTSLERPALATQHAARSVLLGAAFAGSRIVVVGERGIVLLSDDAGVNWRQAQVPVSVTLTAVRFASAREGWAVGHAGTVLSTRDGGQTWQRQLDGQLAAQAILANAKRRGDESGIKLAEQLVADGADKPFLDLHFFDNQRGIVVGAYNLAFTTSDAGLSWQPIGHLLANPKASHLYAVRSRGTVVVIAGEQGMLLRSNDSGATYQRLETPYRGSFFTVELPNDNAIVVAGMRGNALRSDDAGQRWISMATAGSTSITASALTLGGEIWLGNQAGTLWRMSERTLETRQSAPGAATTALLPLADGRLLTLSMRGLGVSPPQQSKAQPQ